MFEGLFVRKTVNVEKALSFGFVKQGEQFEYETSVLDGTFLLQIIISSAGNIDTHLIELETGEEYVLYKTKSEGAFVGEVRNAIETVLTEVSEQCFDLEVFRSKQAKEVIDYVRQTYGDELEFLWQKFPDNAVWRRKDTAKWYGAILTVGRHKLGLDSKEIVEIIDLRIKPDEMETLLQMEHYYPGWHMNKKHWYTIILDGSVDTAEICRRIDESYRLAL